MHLHFNHVAILISAVAQWILGAVWYSPILFAKPWAAMVGVSRETSKQSAMIVGMIASLIGSAILSFVLAHIIVWSGASTMPWGATIGFVLWTGFIAAPLAASYIYEGRPFKLFVINTGYWLVALMMSSVLLACWR
jgi:Protein of unknown function (DUF1761)